MELYEDYKEGGRVKQLWNAREGTITGNISMSYGSKMMDVTFDDGHFMCVNTKDVAPPDHRVHKVMAKWRGEMIERGFNSILVGNKDGKWHAFFFNGNDEYQAIMRKNPGYLWLYYWVITQNKAGNLKLLKPEKSG